MLVQLTMVIGTEDGPMDPEVDMGGEDDGIAATITPRRPVETTSPVVVNSDHVRNFYPRKKRRDGTTPTGTRITFSNGSGMPVTELFEEVAAKLGRMN